MKMSLSPVVINTEQRRITMPSRRKRQAAQRNRIDATTKENNESQKQSRPLVPYPNPYDADVIDIKHHALGRVRMNYRRQQTVDKVITPELKKEYEDGKFLRVCVNSEQHTLIKGTCQSRCLNINRRLQRSHHSLSCSCRCFCICI
jgi:hypothetical protein